MLTDYDNIVLEYWRLPNGNYIANLKKDAGSDGDNNAKTHCQVIYELSY